jgi:hypothetical protein
MKKETLFTAAYSAAITFEDEEIREDVDDVHVPTYIRRYKRNPSLSYR